MVHVHARDAHGKNTGDRGDLCGDHPADPRAIADPDPDHERHRCAPRSGHRSVHLADRRRTARAARPRSATGSVRHRRGIGGLLQPGRRLSRGNAVRELARAAQEDDRGGLREGIGARVRSIVEASALHRLLRYADEGLFDRHRDNMWLLHGGGFGATPPIARNVLFAIDEGLRMFPRRSGASRRRDATCSGSSRSVCRWTAISCASASRTAFTCPTAASRATTARWFARPRIAAIYGLDAGDGRRSARALPDLGTADGRNGLDELGRGSRGSRHRSSC